MIDGAIFLLTSWLKDFFYQYAVILANYIIDLLQDILDAFCDFAVDVVAMFPSGPQLPVISETPVGAVFQEFLVALNWAFPIDHLISIVTFTSLGYLAFIIISPLARLLKLTT